ncbi:apolipoprotein C-I [Nothobranchius furzeri]|uniref:Basic form-like n=1 Tax=Nothobranchius furzeri TaxID=105023 RepID=A0A8C6KCB5_NOTFU|nr:apolipoprotein C-I [Nothobranchius furzeri]KAF7226887.1 basic form-like [Nothobranchius furzeri]
MKLYLAVAVLMLAFVAYTEAQDATGFADFQEKITDFGKTFAENAKTHFETIKNSEFAQNTQNWFTEQFQKLKDQLQSN